MAILLWGFAATVLLTSLTVAAQSLGLTRVDIPFIIGHSAQLYGSGRR